MRRAAGGPRGAPAGHGRCAHCGEMTNAAKASMEEEEEGCNTVQLGLASKKKGRNNLRAQCSRAPQLLFSTAATQVTAAPSQTGLGNLTITERQHVGAPADTFCSQHRPTVRPLPINADPLLTPGL